jgi:hypothetical protein
VGDGTFLPNFLGIGVPRAGTTWLHDLLITHPQVRMPTVRKELNFFDLNYERGLDWYERCFERGSPGEPRAIGEITPVYLYRPECRERIRALGTVERFVVCIREPVDLLWSGYRQNGAIYNFKGDLREFMAARPDVVANGFYARAVKPWIEEFGLEAFLFLRLDEMVHDVEQTKQSVGKFLGVDPESFPPAAGSRQANRSQMPRFPRAYSVTKRTVNVLHRADLSWLVTLGKRLGLRRVVGRESHDDGTLLTAEGRSRLRELYRDDLEEFALLTGQDLSSWLDDA